MFPGYIRYLDFIFRTIIKQRSKTKKDAIFKRKEANGEQAAEATHKKLR